MFTMRSLDVTCFIQPLLFHRWGLNGTESIYEKDLFIVSPHIIVQPLMVLREPDNVVLLERV